jgi:3-oxoacyl-[acyl-carrier-protein] synthase-1
VLTSEPCNNKKEQITIIGGSTSNDANHISGPSRTGEGLYVSIKRAMAQARENREVNLGFISCHGTATPFNDEMESIAFQRAEVNYAPVVGLKGFWGHTLGAAGIIESVAAYHSLLRGVVHGTAGYSELGVTEPVIVYKEPVYVENDTCLKVASGFGGCNAALIFSKK